MIRQDETNTVFSLAKLNSGLLSLCPLKKFLTATILALFDTVFLDRDKVIVHEKKGQYSIILTLCLVSQAY